jgi:hypothetical protein
MLAKGALAAYPAIRFDSVVWTNVRSTTISADILHLAVWTFFANLAFVLGHVVFTMTLGSCPRL